MTAAGDSGAAAHLRSLWVPTLGDGDWSGLSPERSYRPPETQADLPLTEADATLSGLGTLGGKPGRGETQTAPDGTLSARPTLGGESTAPGARVQGPALAGFDLLGEVGRGGMGVVFRARQRSLARDVAIKLIRSGGTAPSARGQFVAEALVNGLLDHPNIVPVHELGTTDQGEVFLAMKLVGGSTWRELLHPRGFVGPAADLERHLGILQSVSNAVAFAHSKGIVHRDLKPENVMVGSFGEVLVMDWGIAVDVRDRVESDARTRHKSTIQSPSGTPAYMPPELALGRGSDIGPWTDTYLLGAILHEILTGRPPHAGANLLEVLLAAGESRPPRLPEGTPGGLARVCTRALEADPARLYRSVAEFQAALGDFLQHRASERIAEEARRTLAQVGGSSRADEAARTRRYGQFAEAIAGFRQALVLWDGNDSARAGEREARVAFARAALESGDVVLAQTQIEALPAGDAEAAVLRREHLDLCAARDRARAMALRMKRALIGGAVLLIVGLGTGLSLLIREQWKSAWTVRDTHQKQEAIAARETALANGALIRRAVHGNAPLELVLLAEGNGDLSGNAEIAGLFEDLDEGDRTLAWASNVNLLLFCDGVGGDVVLARPGPRGERMRLGLFGAEALCGALSEEGRFCALATDSGEVRAYALRDAVADDHGRLRLWEGEPAGAPPTALALDSSAVTLAVAQASRVGLFDLPAGTPLGAAVEASGQIRRLEFRGSELFVVARAGDGTEVLRCDGRTGAVLGRLTVDSTP